MGIFSEPFLIKLPSWTLVEPVLGMILIFSSMKAKTSWVSFLSFSDVAGSICLLFGCFGQVILPCNFFCR